MSPRFKPPVLVWLALAVSTAASCWVALERHKAEAANRAVHFLVDWPDVRWLASSSGKSVDQTLQDMKAAGVTGVAIAEDTWSDLVDSGMVRPNGVNRFRVDDSELGLRLARVFGERLPVAPGDAAVEIVGVGTRIKVPATIAAIRTLGLGFDASVAQQIREAGLTIVARLSNPSSAAQRAIANVVSEATLIGAEGVLLAGDQVLGRRDLVVFSADKIREAGLWFGAVEFASQGGLPRMIRELLPSTVRVHSMVAAEIDKSELPDIVDRYVRAAVERNIRAVFLRPVSNAAENPLAGFLEFVGRVRVGIEREGFEAKPAHTDYPAGRPPWALVAVSFGVAIVSAWLVSLWLSPLWSLAIGSAFLALAAGTYVGFGVKHISLLAALVFPTWAVLAAFSQDNAGGGVAKWVAAYFWITLLSIVGGLHAAAVLTDLPFMLRLDQFMGVKAAHFVPPLVVGVVLLLQQVRWRDLLDGKVRWFDVFVLVFVGVAMLLMLARTGNDAPGDVSALEMKLRNFLDAVLPERPRTKEFLIGYPALVFALWLAYTNRRRFLPLLALIAAIGQASVFNTFCHLHTPLSVSLLRVATGFVVGGLIGLVLLFVVKPFIGGRQSHAS